MARAIQLILTLAVVLVCTTANATPPCNQFFQKQYVQTYATQAVVAYAPVQYLAGQDIQAEALAEKVARLVDKKLELRIQQLSQQQTAPKPQTAIGQHCAKCHSGATPKGGVTFDGLTAIPPNLALAALRSIKDESMPKDHKIDPAVKGQLMEELLALDSSTVAAQRADILGQQPPAQQQRPAELPPPRPVPQGQLE